MYSDATLRDTSPSEWGHGSTGRSSRRSHRSRTSGGFLLSDPKFFEPPGREHAEPRSTHPTPRKESRRDAKGKATARNPDNERVRDTEGTSRGVNGSPLKRQTNRADRDAVAAAEEGRDASQDSRPTIDKALDADSAKIVNLALNLSESRRQAGRRIVSNPIPPTAATFEDNYVGGGLRQHQHIQAQRRISRNMSPQPSKRDAEAVATAPERQSEPARVASPLEAAFDVDGHYQYTFSQATLDRAEKARNALELMGQYRRLMQYLPPLKPTQISRPNSHSPPSTPQPSSSNPYFDVSKIRPGSKRSLGREYNPLQYIRNRKVRARERQLIDGEAEGYGNVADVTTWVDRVAQQAERGAFDMADCLDLPPLVCEEGEMDILSASTSPELTTVKPGVVARKPNFRLRNDWVMKPADMLADVVWLEEDDNKKLIEDNRERKLFPTRANLVRMNTDKSETFLREEETKAKKPLPLKLDTKLPIFKPVRKVIRGDRSRSRSRSRDAAARGRGKFLSGHRGSSPVPERHGSIGYHSESEKSGSELPGVANPPKQARAGTADSHDLGRDVVEKQLNDMLLKEKSNIDSGRTPERPEVRRILSAMETHSPMAYDMDSGSDSGPTRVTPPRRKSAYAGTKKDMARDRERASLEVPSHRPRMSVGTGSEWDMSAPNSPDSRPTKLLGSLIPNISMDLSSPPNRKHSPTRKPALQRVKSKISRLRDRSAEPYASPQGKNEAEDDQTHKELEKKANEPEKKTKEPEKKTKEPGAISPISPDHLQSASPAPKIQLHRRQITKDSIESPTVGALVFGGPLPQQKKPNALARVGDLLWRRDRTNSSSSSSSSGDDDDENEDDSKEGELGEKLTQTSSGGSLLREPRRSFLGEMPTFRSPFTGKESKPRGRSPNPLAAQSPETGDLNLERKRKERLRVPRIDIERASDDPPHADRVAVDHRGSVVSGTTDLSSDLSHVRSADSRLNAILGIPSFNDPNGGILPLSIPGLTHIPGKEHNAPSIWSIDSSSSDFTNLTKKELARLRVQLLRSGLKAREFTRKAEAVQELESEACSLREIPNLEERRRAIGKIPKGQEHKHTAQLLHCDLANSHHEWIESAEKFLAHTAPDIMGTLSVLHEKLDGENGLMRESVETADHADDMNRIIMSVEIQRVKALGDALSTMMRKRRRRFRWARRGGWVLVEWALVGVMWWVWLVVVLLRMARGILRTAGRSVRWLLWL